MLFVIPVTELFCKEFSLTVVDIHILPPGLTKAVFFSLFTPSSLLRGLSTKVLEIYGKILTKKLLNFGNFQVS